MTSMRSEDSHPLDALEEHIEALSGRSTDYDTFVRLVRRATQMVPVENGIHQRCDEFLNSAALVCLAFEMAEGVDVIGGRAELAEAFDKLAPKIRASWDDLFCQGSA
jgi:hypothetical protein